MTEQYPKVEELFRRARPAVQEAPEDDASSPRTSRGTATTTAVSRSSSTSIRTCTAELGAVLYDLGRQPRAARELFIKYQDRLLFGKDTFEPSEFPYYWRVFETRTSISTTTAITTRSGSCTASTLPDAGAEEGLLRERRAPHARACRRPAGRARRKTGRVTLLCFS